MAYNTIWLTTIYNSMFLDNVLLTSVVPILPFMLGQAIKLTHEVNTTNYQQNNSYFENREGDDDASHMIYRTFFTKAPEISKSAAIILSAKSIIQLVLNPLIANFVNFSGYITSLLVGNSILLITSILYSFGGSFQMLMAARGLHGVGSVIISISVMAGAAEKFSDNDRTRSKYMSIILGSEALGVLVGYTLAASIFNVGGKSAAFSVITLIIFINIALILAIPHCNSQTMTSVKESIDFTTCYNFTWIHYIINYRTILFIFMALLMSSSTVAVLEPCLPTWLIEHVQIEQWQTSFIFLPDSLGYVSSANISAIYNSNYGKFGSWKIATIALIIVGLSSILIPHTNNLYQLFLPHFFIGFGIGIIDAILIPILAEFVEQHPGMQYTSIYALQQMTSSLAYLLGSLVGGESVYIIGFSEFLQILGILIITFAIFFHLHGHHLDAIQYTHI